MNEMNGVNHKTKEVDYSTLPMVSIHLDTEYTLLSDRQLRTPQDAIEFVASKIVDNTHETAIAIFMDSSFSPICVATVGQGDGMNTMFSSKEMCQTALLCDASYVTMMHNHPGYTSGKIKVGPSYEDVLVTQTMVNALSMVGVKLYDSIIVSNYRKNRLGISVPVYYSIKEHNYKKLCKKFKVKDIELIQNEDQIVWDLNKEQNEARRILNGTNQVKMYYNVPAQRDETLAEIKKEFLKEMEKSSEPEAEVEV